MAIPEGFRNILEIATPVCALARNDSMFYFSFQAKSFRNSSFSRASKVVSLVM